MNLRVYISVSSLPNTNYTLGLLLDRLEKQSRLCDVFIIHDLDFNPSLFIDIYNNLNLKFILSNEGVQYEYPAFRRLWLDSKNEDFYALYLHVKGASKVKHSEIQNSIAWLEYMLFGTVDNMNVCMYHMNMGADIVGSMWYCHFKGNFFWCKSSYVKTLLDPYLFTTSTRFNSEYWISMPFDKHWLEFSKKLYDVDLKCPSIKNLFYLPIENDQTDFLKLKELNYIPNINQTYATDDILSAMNKGFHAYDEINICKKTYEYVKDNLGPYLNYDAKLNII